MLFKIFCYRWENSYSYSFIIHGAIYGNFEAFCLKFSISCVHLCFKVWLWAPFSIFYRHWSSLMHLVSDAFFISLNWNPLMATNIYHPGSCLGYRDLLMFMMNLASKPGLHNTAHHSVAQTVASLVVTQPVSEAFTLVQNFLQKAQRPHSDWQHIFALLCIGEIGKRIDLNQVPGLGQAISDSFDPPNKEVRLLLLNYLNQSISVFYRWNLQLRTPSDL